MRQIPVEEAQVGDVVANKDLDEKAQAKLVRIEDQVKRIAEVTERLRKLDEIATDEYIRGGEQMIDVWNEGQKGG